MTHPFGTDFIVINDVRQLLNPKIFAGGPWLHLATVRRGFKEYVAFVHAHRRDKAYIEQIDVHSETVFVRIEDDAEWQDLYNFLRDRGYLALTEFKAGKLAGPS